MHILVAAVIVGIGIGLGYNMSLKYLFLLTIVSPIIGIYSWEKAKKIAPLQVGLGCMCTCAIVFVMWTAYLFK